LGALILTASQIEPLVKKTVRKSNTTGDAPLSNFSLTDECIFSAPELAIGDQLMISLKYIGLTDEHCWLETRNLLSVGMNQRLQLCHWFKW
jgi:hypothetical protein